MLVYVDNHISSNITFFFIDTNEGHSEVEADYEDKDQVDAKVHVTNKDANKLPSESILLITAPFVVLKCAMHVHEMKYLYGGVCATVYTFLCMCLGPL